MAQKRPDTDTTTGKIIVAAPESDTELGDRASIDRLLALTDEGWDIDEQVRSLQRAADERASQIDLTPTGEPSIVSVVEVTPPGPRVSSKPPPLPGRPPTLRPPPKKGAPPPRPPPLKRDSKPHPPGDAALPDVLAARIAALEARHDTVGVSRARVELSVVAEAALGDDARAAAQAEAALALDPQCAPAHAILRHRLHGAKSIPTMALHLDAEIAAATEAAGKTELLAARARLCEAAGTDPAATRAAWQETLANAPQHADALKGLEIELHGRAHGLRGETPEARREAADALQEHLARMAEAYGAEGRLGAWLHVERAALLEHDLGKPDAARAALERALDLDGGVGPVRDAVTRFVAAHDDAAALVALLEQEAGLETDGARSARMELDAACVAFGRLGDEGRAVALLERAAHRAPTTPMVDRRALDELVRLHEKSGDLAAAARARRARLRFVSEPRLLAHELRSLASLAERAGDVATAISDMQAAHGHDPTDSALVDALDRLLAATDRHEPRVALWATEAARAEDPAKRAAALLRAARVAEDALAKPSEAVRHLRAAWVATPGDPAILDPLARLLSPAPSEAVDREVRSLVDLYSQAHEHAKDPERRIAYLEKCAVLWEDVAGDARRAARAYEEILAIDPDRRAAILGLARAAARIGDGKAHARALLDEARLSQDGALVLALRVRAAEALAPVDPPRALALVSEVLAKDASHGGARALETRLHEEAGRWERAAESLRARIDRAASPREKLALWLALAEVQQQRLRRPTEALASLQAARALDPAHPVPPEEIARVLATVGDPAVHRAALEGLAAGALTPEERALYLLRAAEIDELSLRDDARAAEGYTKALAEAPDEELAAERLARVLARRGLASPAGLGELAALQSRRLERAASPRDARALSCDLAGLLARAGKDLGRAAALLESVLADEPGHVPALRTLEGIARRTGDTAALARTLGREGDALRDARARLGALWARARIEEWKLPGSDTAATYERILALDPSDPGALEAIVQRSTAAARRGDAAARRTTATALRTLFSLAPDDATRLALQLRLALTIEPLDEREALERFRGALHVDPLSVTAAMSLGRLAAKLGDSESAFVAASSLAELAPNERARARHLLEAAEIALGAGDDRLGEPGARRDRARSLLERALDADPDAVGAAARYSTLSAELAEPERLVEVFRKAQRRATNADAIVLLGSEIARVSRDELKNLPVAIDAMRRVREVAPKHVASLLTLSELCIAQRAWPEAVGALEVVAAVGESGPKLTALFALASIYERVLGKQPEAERALRAALAVDESNPRALRALLRFFGETAGEGGPSQQRLGEMADLLDRLANQERDLEARASLFAELASFRAQLGQRSATERALVEAVACSPRNAKLFARLATCFKTPKGRDDAAYARALGSVVSRGQALGGVSASWYATLGQIETESLGRLREGIGHLRQAIELDPDLGETRFELATACARADAHDDAIRLLSGMVGPDSRRLLAAADPSAVLELLERELLKLHRSEDALAVSELRAIGGDLDDGRHAWLRSRQRDLESSNAALDRPTLVTQVLPQGTRHVLLEVAAAISGIESKILRSDIAELGLSARDRVSSRSGHPTRALLDRVARLLGLEDIELVVTPLVSRTRVITQDELWIVVPRSLTEMPQSAQLAALSRALVRVALGVPWLEELPPPHIEALLVAAARQAAPAYAADAVDVLSAKLVAQYEPSVQRAISRRQRKLLEELAPHMNVPQGRPPAIDEFVTGLVRAELRGAYLVTGDLLVVLDDVRAADAALLRAMDRPGQTALQAVLEHPYAGDLCRFALTPEATVLRRRLGSTWTT